jgi:hypothetical protein
MTFDRQMSASLWRESRHSLKRIIGTLIEEAGVAKQ